MSCAHPFLYNPYTKRHQNRLYSFNQLYFPCGWCTNCRVDKLNQLQHRCEYEYIKFMCGAFVTFTYDDAHLTHLMHYDTIDKKLVASLSKREAKHFLDRVNKSVHKRPNSPFCNHNYKYLIVGEYGEHGTNPALSQRPHFHCLFFGLDFDLCKKVFQEAWRGQGSIYIGNIGDGAIGYCLKYLDKQIMGDLARIKYENHGLERPFQHHSVGLGSGLFEDQSEYIKNHNFQYRWHGHNTPVPIYYRNKYWKNPNSPLKARGILQKRQIENFISEHHRKPKSFFELKKYSLDNALRREKCIKIKERQHGNPANDITPYKAFYNIEQQLNDTSFGFHRLNIPPLDICTIVNQALENHNIKVRRKSWQKRAIDTCKSTDPIPF